MKINLNNVKSMIILIDTHAHPLIIKEFFANKNKISHSMNDFQNMWQKDGIKKIICVSTCLFDYDEYYKISQSSDFYYFSAGIHPCDSFAETIKLQIEELSKKIKNTLQENNNLVAIGETGIDLFHDKKNLTSQIYSFEKQIEISIEHQLPLIIHTRNAFDETYTILNKYKNTLKRGIVHCFGDDFIKAKKWIDLGFYLGIGGSVTYPKNSFLREAIIKIGLENIVLETDSPFLPTQKYRGSINTPSSINEINTFIANLYNVTPKFSSEVIYKNIQIIFNKKI